MTATAWNQGFPVGWRLSVSESTVAAGAFLLLALLPILISGYLIYILPQYMLYGVMAMSVALLWGNCGILSIGQAGFFAIGGYTMGLCFRWISAVNPAYAALLIALLAGAVLAGLVGYFLFRAGVRSPYFVLVSLAISIMVEQVAVSQSQVTGGWNGMYVERMSLTLGPWGPVPLFDDVPMYYVVLVVVATIYGVLRWLVGSKFGKVLAGIRENEDRVIALGFDTATYKTLAFMISGMLAAFAGALYGTHAGFVSPSLGGVLFSTEAVVWVAIGGRSSLLAASLAAIVVASVSNYLSALIPGYWPLVLGTLFITVIIFFQDGVAGAIGPARRRALMRGRRNG
ncbi:MAG TPA: branched-chain amino acid ABC transporter permease [Hyphomicrobiaceae bacterium]|nr:branched-chain amino acid ABC transporter permease [Hyphomicrobiaceae bacterium]